MEATSTPQQSLSGMTADVGEAFCKCGEGWTCVITKTEAAKAGEAFSKCGSSCTCVTDATVDQISNLQQNTAAGNVFVKCGKGWTCVVSKTEGPDAGKTFLECGEGCMCLIDDKNEVKMARV
ncbi:hypothetical protein F0562_007728 [Nyssa sinensis]|uniref:Uncharacterized protein n=1 Tax=Nyssa sinensis TaxID=561372 RepID=A0A5J5A4Q8_9ASTE|nr:hypothetical protein F0562_007728 [Nyssa sinensis]